MRLTCAPETSSRMGSKSLDTDTLLNPTDRPSPVAAPEPEAAWASGEASDSLPGDSSSSFTLGGVPNGETALPGCNPAPAIARIFGGGPRPSEVLDQNTKALLPSNLRD